MPLELCELEVHMSTAAADYADLIDCHVLVALLCWYFLHRSKHGACACSQGISACSTEAAEPPSSPMSCTRKAWPKLGACSHIKGDTSCVIKLLLLIDGDGLGGVWKPGFG